MLSPVVLSLGQTSGWSAMRSSVSMRRCRSTLSLVVTTFMSVSHGRTHEAARTRAPTSTTHMRHTPTGRRRGSWQRAGMSTPMLLAASKMVVPSGTVTSRPSMVRRMRRAGEGLWASLVCARSLSFMRPS